MDEPAATKVTDSLINNNPLVESRYKSGLQNRWINDGFLQAFKLEGTIIEVP